MECALFTGVRLVLSLIGIAIGSLMETNHQRRRFIVVVVAAAAAARWYRKCQVVEGHCRISSGIGQRAISWQNYWTKYYYRIRKRWKSQRRSIVRWPGQRPARHDSEPACSSIPPAAPPGPSIIVGVHIVPRQDNKVLIPKLVEHERAKR